MKKSTLCFCIRDNQVLLAMKKRGFGSGKWNGYGGKVQENETPIQAAGREIGEESGLVVNEENLQPAGVVNFYFEEKPVFECYVYLVHKWEGEPVETEEMSPLWYEISKLPFEEMWASDALWIPLILDGRKIKAELNYSEDGSIVKKFNYKYVEN